MEGLSPSAVQTGSSAWWHCIPKFRADGERSTTIGRKNDEEKPTFCSRSSRFTHSHCICSKTCEGTRIRYLDACNPNRLNKLPTPSVYLTPRRALPPHLRICQKPAGSGQSYQAGLERLFAQLTGYPTNTLSPRSFMLAAQGQPHFQHFQKACPALCYGYLGLGPFNHRDPPAELPPLRCVSATGHCQKVLLVAGFPTRQPTNLIRSGNLSSVLPRFRLYPDHPYLNATAPHKQISKNLKGSHSLIKTSTIMAVTITGLPFIDYSNS